MGSVRRQVRPGTYIWLNIDKYIIVKYQSSSGVGLAALGKLVF